MKKECKLGKETEMDRENKRQNAEKTVDDRKDGSSWMNDTSILYLWQKDEKARYRMKRGKKIKRTKDHKQKLKVKKEESRWNITETLKCEDNYFTIASFYIKNSLAKKVWTAGQENIHS